MLQSLQLASRDVNSILQSSRRFTHLKIVELNFAEVSVYESVTLILEKFGSEIENMQILSCGISGFIDVLNSVPNVKSVLLSDLCCLQEKPILNIEELHLKKLEDLKIDSCDSEFVEVFIDLPKDVLINLFICSKQLRFAEDIFQNQTKIKNLDLSCSVYESDERLNLDQLNLTHLRYENKRATTSEFINILKSQPNLVSLDLFGHKSKSRLLNEIGNLKHLNVLKLNVEKLSIQEFITFKFDSLTELEIEYDHHDHTVDHIQALSYIQNTKLTSLIIKVYDLDFDSEVMTRLAKNNPNLKLIEIENQNLNESIVCAFLKNCKNLETLRTTFCHSESTTNGSFNSLFNETGMENPKLKDLKLFGIKLNLNEILEPLCVNYPNLEVIALSPAPKLFDDDLKYLLQKLTKLRELEITDDLSLASLGLIMEHGTNLETINAPFKFGSIASYYFEKRLKPITFNFERFGG